MGDIYVSAASAEVRNYGSFDLVPSGVVGTAPLDPPDSTYLTTSNHLTSGTGTDTFQIGVAYFDPIDVRSNGSPRFRIRSAGTASAGGYQSYPTLEFYPRATPFDESTRIGSYVYPYPASWYTPGSGGPAGSYAMGTTQEVEVYIPTAVQDQLALDGIVIWIDTNGSSTGAGYIGSQVAEFRIALTAPLSPCYDTLQTLGPVPPLIPSGSAYVGLGTYENRQVTDLSVNFTATSTDTSASAIDSLTIATSTDGLTFNTIASSGSVTIPNDGAPHDFSVPLSLAVTADDATAALSQAGFSYLLFGPASASINVTAASVRAGHKCYIAPANLRLYPRNNATRLYPRRRTRRPGTF